MIIVIQSMVDGRAFEIAEGYAVGAGVLRALGVLSGTWYLPAGRKTVWDIQLGARVSRSARWAIDAGCTRFSRWGQLASGFQLRGVTYF